MYCSRSNRIHIAIILFPAAYAGPRSLDFSLKGGGVYRAVYVVLEEEHVCIDFIVGSHENIYDRAERRVAALKRSGQI
jgi:hypothetical protein